MIYLSFIIEEVNYVDSANRSETLCMHELIAIRRTFAGTEAPWMMLAALGLLTDLWHHCRDFSTRTDTRIAGETSTRSIWSRSSTRTSRTRSPLGGDELAYRSRVFMLFLLAIREEYTAALFSESRVSIVFSCGNSSLTVVVTVV